ncbi:MAG TPA: STAS domain-containing protein [Calditrichia bacterium]|nr:STAS domain-containing protein [Calditrichia bacterium]
MTTEPSPNALQESNLAPNDSSPNDADVSPHTDFDSQNADVEADEPAFEETFEDAESFEITGQDPAEAEETTVSAFEDDGASDLTLLEGDLTIQRAMALYNAFAEKKRQNAPMVVNLSEVTYCDLPILQLWASLLRSDPQNQIVWECREDAPWLENARLSGFDPLVEEILEKAGGENND